MANGEHFRDLVSDELAPDDLVVTPVEITRGMYNEIEDGCLTRVHSFYGKNCRSIRMLDICGAGTTDNEGVGEIRLTDFVCLSQESFVAPVYFVATPRSDSPVHLTFVIDLIDDDPVPEIRIKVFAWNMAGESASRVAFNLRCCVRRTTRVD